MICAAVSANLSTILTIQESNIPPHSLVQGVPLQEQSTLGKTEQHQRWLRVITPIRPQGTHHSSASGCLRHTPLPFSRKHKTRQTHVRASTHFKNTKDNNERDRARPYNSFSSLRSHKESTSHKNYESELQWLASNSRQLDIRRWRQHFPYQVYCS